MHSCEYAQIEVKDCLLSLKISEGITLSDEYSEDEESLIDWCCDRIEESVRKHDQLYGKTNVEFVEFMKRLVSEGDTMPDSSIDKKMNL